LRKFSPSPVSTIPGDGIVRIGGYNTMFDFIYYLCKCQRVAPVRRLSRTCDAEMSRLVGPSSGLAPVRPAIDSESSPPRSTAKAQVCQWRRQPCLSSRVSLKNREKFASHRPINCREYTVHEPLNRSQLCCSTPFCKLDQLRFRTEKTANGFIRLPGRQLGYRFREQINWTKVDKPN
jgi:hypothetical protein